MSLIKQIKDYVRKAIFREPNAQSGLFELHEYFRLYGPIEFNREQTTEGIVAVSANFRYGSIISSGRDEQELDKNIKDAILTSFSIPSAYAREARIVQQGNQGGIYAVA